MLSSVKLCETLWNSVKSFNIFQGISTPWRSWVSRVSRCLQVRLLGGVGALGSLLDRREEGVLLWRCGPRMCSSTAAWKVMAIQMTQAVLSFLCGEHLNGMATWGLTATQQEQIGRLRGQRHLETNSNAIVTIDPARCTACLRGAELIKSLESQNSSNFRVAVVAFFKVGSNSRQKPEMPQKYFYLICDFNVFWSPSSVVILLLSSALPVFRVGNVWGFSHQKTTVKQLGTISPDPGCAFQLWFRLGSGWVPAARILPGKEEVLLQLWWWLSWSRSRCSPDLILVATFHNDTPATCPCAAAFRSQGVWLQWHPGTVREQICWVW